MHVKGYHKLQQVNDDDVFVGVLVG